LCRKTRSGFTATLRTVLMRIRTCYSVAVANEEAHSGKQYIVGARRTEDGGFDFSHAATFIPDSPGPSFGTAGQVNVASDRVATTEEAVDTPVVSEQATAQERLERTIQVAEGIGISEEMLRRWVNRLSLDSKPLAQTALLANP